MSKSITSAAVAVLAPAAKMPTQSEARSTFFAFKVFLLMLNLKRFNHRRGLAWWPSLLLSQLLQSRCRANLGLEN
ncbi:hypothetical protein [Thioalkalivibrio sp. AKL7]|uniref:hypothetical protein n=1 Tax=Thioalkalivibrio sp. AKL7 TaxID=1158155 RepID=UPI0018C9DC33|nr:hypothetical protein [Thioalkalivibrio sp. AKL7]